MAAIVINDITIIYLDFLLNLFRKEGVWKLPLLFLITLSLSCQSAYNWTFCVCVCISSSISIITELSDFTASQLCTL